MKRVFHTPRLASQKDLILAHLRRHGHISPMEALDLYGSYRLGARIRDLREEGHGIVTRITREDGKPHTRYELQSE